VINRQLNRNNNSFIAKNCTIYLVLFSLVSQNVLAAPGSGAPLVTGTSGRPPAALPITLDSQEGARADKDSTCCDPRYMLSLLNPREVLFPVTAQKAGYWLAMTMVVGGLVVAGLYGYLDAIPEAFKYNNFIILGVIYGIEPTIMFYNLLVGQYPALNPIPSLNPGDLEAQTHSSCSEDTALIIPCHNSVGEITKTLGAALQHFPPEHIFIVDNGQTEGPTDTTKELADRINPRINYIWSSIGNKSVAEYAGALAANKFKYVMIMDDDVALPANFKVPVDKMNDQLVHAVSFGIAATDKNGKTPWLVACQDLEYKASDAAKLAEDRTFGVLYPHGAASLWNRETLLEVLRNHNLLFFTEDVKLGAGLQALGKRMAFDARVVLDTEVPTSVFGTPPNYWNQRVKFWELGRHLITLDFLIGFFALNRDAKLFHSEKELLKSQKNVESLPARDTLWLLAKTGVFMIPKKGIQLYTVAGNVADWIRFPLIVTMATNPSFWTSTGALLCFPIIPVILWKGKLWLSNRQDLDKSNILTTITFPFYKLIYSAASSAALIRMILTYLPNTNGMQKIQELESAGDPRCVWLKPEFRERFGLPPTGAEAQVIEE